MNIANNYRDMVNIQSLKQEQDEIDNLAEN